MSQHNPPASNDEHDEDINEQLLRTIRYTGKTNEQVMATQAAVLSIAEKIVETSRSQERIARMRFFLFVIPIVLMLVFYAKQWYDESQINVFDDGYVAQVKITGPIMEGSKTSGSDAVIPALQLAFDDEKAMGVLIRISTPGGSPGQSEAIRDEIVRLQEVHPEKEVAIIGEEIMTSGGYWIATASPEIYALRTTYIGSIGVIGSSFNYAKLIDALGVERVVTTSGKSKSTLDPYKPIKQADIDKQKRIMSGIHEDFIDLVKTSRADKLTAEDDYLFNGDYWRGSEAKSLGLIDDVTTVTRLLSEKFGTENVVDYSSRPGFFDNIFPKIQINVGHSSASTPQLIEPAFQ